jgi:hypothetical protein
VLLLATSACAGLCFPGCATVDAPKYTGWEMPGADRSSPQAVLKSLREAYMLLEPSVYDSLLAEDFEFRFSAEDQQIGVTLTRGQEMTIHGNMCNSPDVDKIVLTFVLSEPTLDEDKPNAGHPGEFLWTVLMTNTDLTLYTNAQTYLVENAIERFWFRQSEGVANGPAGPVWKIVEWDEIGLSPGNAVGNAPERASATTWGRIKSIFRPR